MPEKYEAILDLINETLKSNATMLVFLRERVAELEKENAQLKEKIEDLTF